ncbi:MAG: DnaJ domain-containing protein [Deltaproteobacteria bacterium]|nr:DnaJ domain-containing protein [Deltaproteobacteria bacterium]
MTTPHWYGVLGVAPDADLEAIKRAYRALAARWHPDHAAPRGEAARDRAEARMKVVGEAWSILADAERRQAYDALLRAIEEAGAPRAIWVDRVFGVKARQAEPGRNRRYRVIVGLADVVRGTERILELPTRETCGACAGAGWDPSGPPVVCPACAGRSEVVTRPVVRAAWDVCGHCGGRGWVPEIACATCQGEGEVAGHARIVAPIPAGVRPGELLRIRGHGEPGDPPGDLLVEVQVEPDPRFEVRGLDVVHRRAVPFWKALVGGPLEVFTAWGPAVVELPVGTRDGDELRLPDWGVAREGDQRVVIAVEWPTTLDGEARAALAAWGARLPERCFPASYAAAGQVSPDGGDQ